MAQESPATFLAPTQESLAMDQESPATSPVPAQESLVQYQAPAVAEGGGLAKTRCTQAERNSGCRGILGRKKGRVRMGAGRGGDRREVEGGHFGG